MRLRRTAAGGIAAVLALASCSSSGGGSAGSSLLEATTSSEMTTTTTVVASTTSTVPPPTTTTVVADATTADPKALAQQLQAVLDRYEALIVRSRSDPNLPFTDQQLIDDLQAVATNEFLGLFWIPKWQAHRDEGTAARPGPMGFQRVLVNSVVPVDGANVKLGYCFFDDGVTYRPTDGAVIDGRSYIDRGSVQMVKGDGEWRLNDFKSESYVPSSENPCEGEAVAP
jgi:hypothetical protein